MFTSRTITLSDIDTGNVTDFTLSDIGMANVTEYTLPEIGVDLYLGYTCILSLLAATGNGIVLLVQYYNKRKTTTDWLVVFLSCHDSALVVFNLPVTILFHSGSWARVGSDAFCGVINYVMAVFIISSSMLLTATAFDRYMKTCRPHSTLLTPRRMIKTCACLTLVSMVISTPALGVSRYDSFNKCAYKRGTVLAACLSFSQFILAFVMFPTVLVSYAKVALAIRKRLSKVSAQSNTAIQIRDEAGVSSNHMYKANSSKTTGEGTKQAQNSGLGGVNSDCANTRIRSKLPVINERNGLERKRTNQTTFMMFCISAVFFLSWIPVYVSVIVWQGQKTKSVVGNAILLFCRRFYFINTFTNPLFCILMSSKFRKASKDVLTKVWSSITRCHCTCTD